MFRHYGQTLNNILVLDNFKNNMKISKYLKLSLFIFINIFFPGNLKSQSFYDFGFEQDFSVVVRDNYGNVLDYAWWGGLNAVHFGTMDINNNGIDDLVIFEKHGNKILPLINQNIKGKFSYVYAPEYIRFFPSALTDWVIFYDFNNDGKKDIFTYTTGGIKVYRNTTTTGNLSFELYSELLLSKQYGDYINIYLTEVDYPVIDDIDGDGDVDILTFFGLGRYVEWHRNMGVELYNNPDVMDFHRTQRCWGNFLKREGSDVLFLKIDCPWGPGKPKISKEDNLDKFIMHPGHTMLFADLNGNGLKDFLIGNIDQPGLIMLTNAGAPDSSHFVSQDLRFPSNTKPVNLFSSPVPSYIDINNDGIKELLVSSFNPSLYVPENKNSVWLYNNNGTNARPVFGFETENFLQNKMIDVGGGAYPVFHDYNNNGLLDLFVANYGVRTKSYYDHGHLHSNFVSKIALFENTGTTENPEFKLVTEDFANISELELLSVYPAFTDLDGDGNIDMLLGTKDGTLHYFENITGIGNTMKLVYSQSNFLKIDVGQYATPAFFDLNKDGLQDLIIGNRDGYLYYYENTGTTDNPKFTLVTRNLGGVHLADLTQSQYGHSVPTFYSDSKGNTHLFCGTASGYVIHYKNLDAHFNGTFTIVDTVFVVHWNEKHNVKTGIRASAAIADLNNDGYPDIIIGNYAGGLNYFKGIGLKIED